MYKMQCTLYIIAFERAKETIQNFVLVNVNIIKIIVGCLKLLYFKQHCFTCRLSISTMSEDAEIEPYYVHVTCF